MPKSRIRKKNAYARPAGTANRKKYGSPLTAPFMVAFFLIGIAWLVVYYLSQAQAPVSAFGSWNLLVGFGFLIAGFVMSTRWR